MNTMMSASNEAANLSLGNLQKSEDFIASLEMRLKYAAIIKHFAKIFNFLA